MRKRIVGGILSLGLLAGCGGVEADGSEEPALSTQEEALNNCTATYHVKYYSDATYTTQVGMDICLVCNRPVAKSGIKTAFAKWLMPMQLCEPYDP
ncbi:MULTISPECIES: hypothetical protein [unclassified Corallococcus]|uniref:hypothetical protein n=1 Tax=unclassified Corallococcus TaxID=2685029 RepID=UPI001A8D926F|nr:MULTISPECIES: hypothetical protein [unclassified Corallococcus]MBN9682508.1 hypothetical protein [Corallococcus sp. NCSPR001]WAS85940.1 hypothetical protein O0N60_02975 [Corallococcus sp. NCRR]